jgi:hypothetical protein
MGVSGLGYCHLQNIRSLPVGYDHGNRRIILRMQVLPPTAAAAMAGSAATGSGH